MVSAQVKLRLKFEKILFLSHPSLKSVQNDLSRISRDIQLHEAERLISIFGFQRSTTQSFRSNIIKAIRQHPPFYYEKIEFGSPLNIEISPSSIATAFMISMIISVLKESWKKTKSYKAIEELLSSNIRIKLLEEPKAIRKEALKLVSTYIAQDRFIVLPDLIESEFNKRTHIGPFLIRDVERISELESILIQVTAQPVPDRIHPPKYDLDHIVKTYGKYLS